MAVALVQRSALNSKADDERGDLLPLSSTFSGFCRRRSDLVTACRSDSCVGGSRHQSSKTAYSRAHAKAFCWVHLP